MTVPFLIQILFAFFLVDLFIITVWAAIELVDEIRKRIRETPEEASSQESVVSSHLTPSLSPEGEEGAARMEDGK